jgi:hypothetical protein
LTGRASSQMKPALPGLCRCEPFACEGWMAPIHLDAPPHRPLRPHDTRSEARLGRARRSMQPAVMKACRRLRDALGVSRCPAPLGLARPTVHQHHNARDSLQHHTVNGCRAVLPSPVNFFPWASSLCTSWSLSNASVIAS